MQEREAVHRGCGGLARAAAAAAILVFVGTGGPTAVRCDVAATGIASAMSGGVPPCLELGVLAADEDLAGAFCACSRPYALDDLTATLVGAGFSVRGRAAWARWHHLGHPLYREDRLALSVGSRLPVRSCSLYICPAVERRAVRAFPAHSFALLSCSVQYQYDRSLALGIQYTPLGGGSCVVHPALLFCGIRGGCVAASVCRVVAGGGDGYTWVRCAVELGDGLALFSEYHMPTDECGFGITAAFHSLRLGFSWSYHPDLGATASAGFGRWWTW
jgi:hypothetical protein